MVSKIVIILSMQSKNTISIISDYIMVLEIHRFFLQYCYTQDELYPNTKLSLPYCLFELLGASDSGAGGLTSEAEKNIKQ